MVISKIFWCSDFLYQIVKKKRLSDVIFHQRFFDDVDLYMRRMSDTAIEDKS